MVVQIDTNEMQVCIFGPGEMDVGRQSIFFSDRELQTDMTNIEILEDYVHTL